MTILQTQRLILRRFTLDDTPFIIELLNTDEWIKYIGERNVKTIHDAENYLRKGPMKSYEAHGFGLSLVALQSGEPIGMCGLLKRDHLEHPDIGFAFLPRHGKKGYAFEIANAYLDHAFKTLKPEKILAITVPDNRNSIQLLQKLGFTFEKDISENGEALKLFGINSHI